MKHSYVTSNALCCCVCRDMVQSGHVGHVDQDRRTFDTSLASGVPPFEAFTCFDRVRLIAWRRRLPFSGKCRWGQGIFVPTANLIFGLCPAYTIKKRPCGTLWWVTEKYPYVFYLIRSLGRFISPIFFHFIHWPFVFIRTYESFLFLFHWFLTGFSSGFLSIYSVWFGFMAHQPLLVISCQIPFLHMYQMYNM